MDVAENHPDVGDPSRPARRRNLRIVKLTPVALGFCNSCNMEFQSLAPIEDDAESEMKAAFNAHTCRS